MTGRGRFRGKTAIVTGATSGIGHATVERLRAESAKVYGLDIEPGPGTDMVLDVTDEDAIESVFESIVARNGAVDICIANAGVIQMSSLLVQRLPDWERTLAVNLTGAFLTLRAGARSMIEVQRRGVLLAVASGAGLRGEAGAGAYSASKFGVIGLVQAMALELASHGIRVAAVAPGEIDTPLMGRLIEQTASGRGEDAARTRAYLGSQIPLQRLGSPDEVAAVLAFLASDDASYITGEVIRVDGGELIAGQTIPPPTDSD